MFIVVILVMFHTSVPKSPEMSELLLLSVVIDVGTACQIVIKSSLVGLLLDANAIVEGIIVHIFVG